MFEAGTPRTSQRVVPPRVVSPVRVRLRTALDCVAPLLMIAPASPGPAPEVVINSGPIANPLRFNCPALVMIVPPFVNPNAAVLPMATVPSLMIVLPLKSFEVANVSTPVPSLVRAASPLIFPLPLNVNGEDVLLTITSVGDSAPVRLIAGEADPVSNKTVSPWKKVSGLPPRSQLVVAFTSHKFALPSPCQTNASGAPEICTRISPGVESSKI